MKSNYTKKSSVSNPKATAKQIAKKLKSKYPARNLQQPNKNTMPNLTQKTLDEAVEFKELLDAIMTAKTDEERQEAYEAFTQHKIVEKQFNIVIKKPTTGKAKRVICPHCLCATTHLKDHQKTMKCHEIYEAKDKEFGDDVIKLKAVEDKSERRVDYTNMSWLMREDKAKEMFGAPIPKPKKRKLKIVSTL